MTGPWKAWYNVALTVAALLACSICYYTGKNQQALDDALRQSKALIVKVDSVIRLDSARTDSARKISVNADSAYGKARTKIKVVHDTVTTPQGVYVDTALARVIHSADSAQTAHKVERAQDLSQIASLRAGISLRDDRIKLLESKGSPRTSRGIQLGVGYCATASGNTPCAFVGYGFSVRFP